VIDLHKSILVLLVFALSLVACSSHFEQARVTGDLSSCHIIYDAGSSKTRLYIYQQTGAGWVKHRGPKTDALADPVREIRGKTMSDAGSVVGDIVRALEDMRRDGPPNKKGAPGWPAFDWQEHCDIESVAVYATAGMRLAEQQDTAASDILWKMLNDRLAAAVGMRVVTRTLTGYEEGLFAWLAIRERQDDGVFGVAEMGGASVQITLPCPGCKISRQVKVNGHAMPINSNSYLGWGQDEAWKKLGPLSACALGVGKKNQDWEIADCAAGMEISSHASAELKKYIETRGELRWYLSGAFRHMRNTDIDHFCRQGIDSGFEPLTSCFRAVYLPRVLSTLGVPDTAEPTDVDWTLGAVICTSTQCLE
jgi:hypothetical protein